METIHNIEPLADSFQKHRFGKTVQVPHGTVVIHDPKLIVGIQNGQHEMVRLIPLVIRIPLPAETRHRGSRGSAVMPIRDVKRLDRGKFLPKLQDLCRIAQDPDCMADIVIGGKIEFGGSFHHTPDQSIDLFPLAVGHQNRPGLRPNRIDVQRSLPLLVRAREFVLPDPAPFVFFNRNAGNESCLNMLAHSLPVKIKSCLIFRNQDALPNQPFQIFFRPLIDAGIFHTVCGGEIDFRLLHMEKIQRFVPHPFLRLFHIHHIIGQRGHLIRKQRRGSQGPEGEYIGHACSLSETVRRHFETASRE